LRELVPEEVLVPFVQAFVLATKSAQAASGVHSARSLKRETRIQNRLAELNHQIHTRNDFSRIEQEAWSSQYVEITNSILNGTCELAEARARYAQLGVQPLSVKDPYLTQLPEAERREEEEEEEDFVLPDTMSGLLA